MINIGFKKSKLPISKVINKKSTPPTVQVSWPSHPRNSLKNPYEFKYNTGGFMNKPPVFAYLKMVILLIIS